MSKQIATKATKFVRANTVNPYNTAHINFKASHHLVQQSNQSEYIAGIISYLKDVQSFTITPEFKTYANRVLNKDFKESKLLPGSQEFNMEASIPDGEFIVDNDLINTVHSETMFQETENFFRFKPYMNSIAMDMYLSLNPKYFNEIKQQRAESILKWGLEVSRENRQ